MKNFNEREYIDRVKNIDWSDLYATENVDEAVFKFTEKLGNILDELAPVKLVQPRSKYAPWLKATTKELKIERDRLRELAAETKS